MRRKILTGCLAAFFVFIAAATVIAENIYYDSLPVVEVGFVKEDTLSKQVDLTGQIVYGKREHAYRLPISCSTVMALAKNGGFVESGDPLYQVPADEVLKQQKQLELALLSLEEENSLLSADGDTGNLSEEERLVYEINEIDIASQKEKIHRLEDLVQSGGIVYADQTGYICYTDVAEAGVSAAEGELILVLEKDTGERMVEWTMSAEDGALFGIGDTVELMAEVEEKSDDIDMEEKKTLLEVQKIPIISSEFSKESQTYLFQARFPEDIILKMRDGAEVSLSCRYESKEKFPFVIPTEAIVPDGDNSARIFSVQSRKRVYGEEYYVVESSAQIQRTVGGNTALVNAFEEVEYVLSSTANLRDGMVVRRKAESVK